jgi:hypothetical protein
MMNVKISKSHSKPFAPELYARLEARHRKTFIVPALLRTKEATSGT